MDITKPPRLAVGSWEAGEGFGCGMNVIAWETGEQEITDLPSCAHPLLAGLVHFINDTTCTQKTKRGYVGFTPVGSPVRKEAELLCPECSIVVLDLAHRTVNTAGLIGDVDMALLMLGVLRQHLRLRLGWDELQEAELDGEIEATVSMMTRLSRASEGMPPHKIDNLMDSWRMGVTELVTGYLWDGSRMTRLGHDETLKFGHAVFDRVELATGMVAPKPEPAAVAEALEWMENGERVSVE